MIIAVCDPKGIAIEAIKTILYHDKGLSDRISRIYEFWNMEQLLDASRDSSFDCIVFPNYCNSHNSVVCSLSCGYNRFPLVEHDPRYTLIVRDLMVVARQSGLFRIRRSKRWLHWWRISPAVMALENWLRVKI